MRVFLVIFGAILGSLFSGFLWSLGGQSGWSKRWRRLGVPIVMGGITLGIIAGFHGLTIANWVIFGLTYFLFAASLTLGYGIPDNGDNGSPIGRFWLETAMEYGYRGEDAIHVANVLTRATVGVCYAISLYPFCIITGRWLYALLPTVVSILLTLVFGALAPDYPPVKVFNINLNGEEFRIGCVVGLCGILVLL